MEAGFRAYGSEGGSYLLKGFYFVKTLIQAIQKRTKGILLLSMLVLPFCLYAAARNESFGWVCFLLILMTAMMIVAMRSA